MYLEFLDILFKLCDEFFSTLDAFEQILQVLFVHEHMIFPVESGDDDFSDQTADLVPILVGLAQRNVFWKDS